MTEDNGNVSLLKPTSSSEDVSEYTDADESISAPTEFLAEFLSAVMLKDYETALKYCKLILQYEPNNGTAREFYPLIIAKLQQSKLNGNNDEGDNNSESADDDDDSTNSSSSDSESGTDESSEEHEEVGAEQGANKRSKGSSDGTTGSYSSLEDDEAELDQLAALAARYQVDNADFGNGNKIYGTVNLKSIFDNKHTEGIKSTVNHVPFGTSSDSESPTEPVTQQTIAMLRAKVVPSQH
ncbi:hypothetical protein RN001_006477 [Aquatica leii]|uniref:Uncharacterized protein n=1 Tax=Aquatica leii TaxID=1421715 RepID=A0AAN7QL04_9COLE|nr:hypothetical protein RN001_006477 [Aquatica leii]